MFAHGGGLLCLVSDFDNQILHRNLHHLNSVRFSGYRPDSTKIKTCLYQNLASSPADQILVKALCGVAKGFGKKATSGFVENAATLVLLEELQINYAQGYFRGRPVHARESFFKPR